MHTQVWDQPSQPLRIKAGELHSCMEPVGSSSARIHVSASWTALPLALTALTSGVAHGEAGVTHTVTAWTWQNWVDGVRTGRNVDSGVLSRYNSRGREFLPEKLTRLRPLLLPIDLLEIQSPAIDKLKTQDRDTSPTHRLPVGQSAEKKVSPSPSAALKRFSPFFVSWYSISLCAICAHTCQV